MFKTAKIIETPTGRFVFVGRVPGQLVNKSFATKDEAKIAAVDLMISGIEFAVS